MARSSEASLEEEGLVQAEPAETGTRAERQWPGRRWLTTGLAVAVASALAVVLATCRGDTSTLKATAAVPQTREQAKGPPPPRSTWLLNEYEFKVPSGPHDEPHMHQPPASQLMGPGEEECTGDCAEGDELLDPAQKAARAHARLLTEDADPSVGINNVSGSTELRAPRALSDFWEVEYWPHGVVKYSWDSAIDPAARADLEKAMLRWTAKTCLKFEEAPKGLGVIHYQSSAKGCNAHVGYSTHHPHRLNLEAHVCTNSVGIAVHELGHVIGLRHEHAKPEAKEFIEFLPHNVMPGWKQWLRFYENPGDMSAGIPYDMSSIMHYGPWAGGKSHSGESRKTIKVKKKDTWGNCQMGNREFLSAGDILTVNKWYGCPHHFCADLHEDCAWWKDQGHCDNDYKEWMSENCPHSCGVCTCEDKDSDCPQLASGGYCLRGEKGTSHNKQWMLENCRKSCGNCLLEDSQVCKDGDGCSEHTDCHHSWWVKTCPQTCNACPHQPFCW